MHDGTTGSDQGLTASVERHLPAARAGAPGAVERVVETVRPFVLRWCRARVGLPGDDIAQQVCAAIGDAVRSHRPGRRPFLAEVVDITHAATVEAYRRTHLTIMASDRELRDLLDRLAEGRQAVLILRVIEGLSYEEIAGLFGSTAEDVRMTQHHALRDLAAMTSSPSFPDT